MMVVLYLSNIHFKNGKNKNRFHYKSCQQHGMKSNTANALRLNKLMLIRNNIRERTTVRIEARPEFWREKELQLLLYAFVYYIKLCIQRAKLCLSVRAHTYVCLCVRVCMCVCVCVHACFCRCLIVICTTFGIYGSLDKFLNLMLSRVKNN